MKQIPTDVAIAAERLLKTDDGQTLMGFLIKDYGLMDRAFIQDGHGKVSPINAAIRDGERGVVGFLFKLSQGETFQQKEAK
jgi:hypothetical protein